jgi:hypothetical protein
MQREAYTDTVVGPAQLGLALLGAAAVVAASALLAAPPWPVAAALAVVFVAVGLHLATVRLTAGADRVLLGQGPWGRPGRWIDVADVVSCSAMAVTWPEVFGVGLPFHRLTTRMTVRPGPALHLVLRDGEHIRISTTDPDTAVRILTGDGRLPLTSAGADLAAHRPTGPERNEEKR